MFIWSKRTHKSRILSKSHFQTIAKTYGFCVSRFFLLFRPNIFLRSRNRRKERVCSVVFLRGTVFSAFGIGKTRNGIGHRFTVFLQFAKFEIYFFLFGRCSRGRNFLLVVVFAKSGFRNFGKLSDDAIFVFYVAHFLPPVPILAHFAQKERQEAKQDKMRYYSSFFSLICRELFRTFIKVLYAFSRLIFLIFLTISGSTAVPETYAKTP